jgi:subtilisin family serine protease
MHIYTASRKKIALELLPEEPGLRAVGGRAVADVMASASPVMRASRAFFELGRTRGPVAAAAAPAGGPRPAAFRERRTGLLRTVYRELVMRFEPGTAERVQRAILKKHGLIARRRNPYVPDQLVAVDPARKRWGADLVEIANRCADLDEVVFATPNFVSEYRRQALPGIPATQWHLNNLGKVPGQKKGEDVDARDAWKISAGKRSIVVAVLDDGVDIEHPNLKGRIWTNPDPKAKDRVGRDFFLPDDHPDHYNPRPKKFRAPFDQMTGNDIHGTPCAGVVAAAGHDALGIAFKCRVLAVKIFHGDDLAADERVADAIRYAAQHADILSCSWSGGASPDIELALQDAGRIGRKGRGAAVFCAAGNEDGDPVGFPASDPQAIAVGASTDTGRLASYSNVGPELDCVAPSSGGKLGIYTTDVSYPGRGFNLGKADAGGTDGRHTNDFGGTSSATPLAAGVGALVLSVNAKLDREAVRGILRQTADKIGSGYDSKGHSNKFGYGRVNAARAAAAARP